MHLTNVSEWHTIIPARDGVWRSLVARSAGGREVAGSNPVTPTFYKDLITYIT